MLSGPTKSIESISILISSFAAGGAERAMINFANGLVARGYRIDLLVSNSQGPFRKLVAEDINIIDLNRGVLRSLPSIRKHLIQHKPDILFASQVHVNLGAILASLGRKIRTKVVIREASTPSEYAKEDSTRKHKFVLAMARRFFRYADHMIAVGEDSRLDCIKHYRLKEDQVSTVYSSLVTNDIYKKAEQEINHPWFKDGSRVLASMGRVMPVKDFLTLIDAFAKVRTSTPNFSEPGCRLIIIGETDRDPEYFNMVTQCVNQHALKDHVDFVGFHENPFPYLAQSEVYVLSSKYEGMPGALVQAMALGCKLVSTDCRSGPREVLENGLRGALVPVGDSDAMAQAIVNALNIDCDREKGRQWSKAFTEETSLNNLIEIFAKVAKSKA